MVHAINDHKRMSGTSVDQLLKACWDGNTFDGNSSGWLEDVLGEVEMRPFGEREREGGGGETYAEVVRKNECS